MKLSGLIVSGALLIGSVNTYAGIPVIDAANLIQSIQQCISWVVQAQDMVTSIQAEHDTLKNMTGTRMLGLVSNDPSLQSLLPADVATIYGNVGSGGYSNLTSNAKSVRDANRIYNCEGMSADFSAICSASLNSNAQDIAYGDSAYQTATSRNAQIQQLMARINSTTDEKEISELQARIQGENTSVANESNRIQIWQQLAAANAKANEQKAAEWYVKAVQRDSVLTGSVYTP